MWNEYYISTISVCEFPKAEMMEVVFGKGERKCSTPRPSCLLALWTWNGHWRYASVKVKALMQTVKRLIESNLRHTSIPPLCVTATEGCYTIQPKRLNPSFSFIFLFFFFFLPMTLSYYCTSLPLGNFCYFLTLTRFPFPCSAYPVSHACLTSIRVPCISDTCTLKCQSPVSKVSQLEVSCAS